MIMAMLMDFLPGLIRLTISIIYLKKRNDKFKDFKIRERKTKLPSSK